ncbi:diacylglycerol kinase [Neptunicella marina]|uniref:Diacylglycerol kinase n=2 Tax=Neptunicella marina TaxID=2125989 RepID=A0A8J6IR45_9ALTE|nr:diacylglycerol kinase [Neptunicella marina]
MIKPNGRGFTRVINAAKCSIEGLGYAYRHEEAFRMELGICAVLIPLSFWLAESPSEFLTLVLPLMAILVVECINSAIEAGIDRISTDIHPLSKQAKDLGSAAVFLTMLITGICWLSVLFF